MVINGPNLNMLGLREKGHYGEITLDKINDNMLDISKNLGIKINFFQSNHEGEIVTKIQNSRDVDGFIVNLGAYTHTSIAIRDALLAVDKPIIEVHLSNIYKREQFRHKSYVSDIAVGVIAGFKEDSYYLALRALYNLLKEK